MTNILDQLNERQREAVRYCDGPELVIAGAGSGKTRVLTYKIAYLLQHPDMGLNPWNILALTFTNKAAKEMKERVAKLVGTELAMGLNMGTFHSVFSRILRREAAHIGFTSNYTIYDEADARSLINSIIKDMGLDDNIYKAANVRYHISMAKNRLVTAEMYANDSVAMRADEQNDMGEIHNIYTMYEQRCHASNAMDFDDLLLNTYLLFKNNPEVREHYAQRFKYMLVDEYQDTNYAQQCIVYQLTKEHHNICVVGDDAQSIYGFRGANIDNILDFNKLYDNVVTIKLEQNYRSTQRIVEAANSLIMHNERQIRKDVFSRNAEGEAIEYVTCFSDRLEASYVAREIRRIMRLEDLDFNDFAILYRTNSQSRCFEDEFRRLSIPYKIYGGLSFYQRKEIKDILAYFRVVINPNDEEAMKRVIVTPKRGIGASTISKISDKANEWAVSFWQVLTDTSSYQLAVNKGTQAKLDKFAELISTFIEKANTTDAASMAEFIIRQSGLHAEIFGDKTPEGLARQENVDELLNELQEFVDIKREENNDDEIYLGNFLQEVSLLTDKESDDEAECRVSLMTIHAAKGLEFPTVFVVGMEENIFPGQRSAGNPRQLEEERRLLYVAITRAEKHCYLTCAKTRYRYGKTEYDIPSRFIKDIDPCFMHTANDDEDSVGEKITSFGSSRGSSYGSSRGSSFGSSLGSSRNSFNGSTASSLRQEPTSKQRHPIPSIPRSAMSVPRQSVARLGSSLDQISTSSRLSQSRPSNGNLAVGAKIVHQRFGKGEILRIEGKGENTKATVRFEEVGQKQLLVKFARFEVIK